MRTFETQSFGVIAYEPESAVEFPAGLPGFEERRRFVALCFPDSEPLVYLQSLEDPGLCFLALPVLAVDPQYRLEVCAEERALIGLAPEQPLRFGKEVLCLTIISLRETGPTANLLAPVVINLSNRKAVQSVAAESGYSHQHVLVPEEAPVCS